MENQQLEFDFDKEMSPAEQNPQTELPPVHTLVPDRLVLTLTGNPWTDFGIVSFCRALRNAYFVDELIFREHEAIITLENRELETVEEWLKQVFRERWNHLFWLSRGAKILKRTLTYDDNDFVNQDLPKMPISEEERAQIKAEWKNSPLKDLMPLTQWRFSFIGTSTDARGFRKNLDANLQDFLQNWRKPTGKKVCEMSGKPTDKLKRLLQVVNPFASKHHNTRVRGFHGSATNPKVGALYYLLSLCTTLDEGVPFVYDPAGKQVRHLILPDIPNLDLLAKVYDRLQENLRDDLRENELYPYTNFRLKLQMSNRYSLALWLFHHIFYDFTLSDEDDDDTEGEWDFSPPIEEPEETVKQLTRWVIIPFSKGQNVIFQNFHTVVVNEQLYKFIKPISYKQGEIQLVFDILARMYPKSPDAETALGQLSQAIATSAPSLMKIALFNLWKYEDSINYKLKQGAPHPVHLLTPFINHFLEVNQVLDDKLREDLRALGTTIGGTFNKDMTLISRLFNISSVSDFRETLTVVMFRFYKLSAGGNAKEAIPLKQERVDSILTQLTEDNYRETAETLSIYVSLSAYNANVFKSKSDDNKGDQDD